MLKNGLYISWHVSIYSDKIDFYLTKIGIFKSWLVTGKDSIFQIFALKKHMQVHGLSISICGKKKLLPSIQTNDSTCKEEWYGTKWDCCRNVFLLSSRLKNGAAWQPHSGEKDGSHCNTAERWGLKFWNGSAYHSPRQTANTIKSSLAVVCNKVSNVVLYLLSVKRGKFLLHICPWKATQPLDCLLSKMLCGSNNLQIVHTKFANSILSYLAHMKNLFSQWVSLKAFKIKDWLLKEPTLLKIIPNKPVCLACIYV